MGNPRLLEFLSKHEREDPRYDLGSFYTDPQLGKPNRCDLHPRWSPDARSVCIDSIHEGERQMYLVDVSSLTARE